VSVEVLDCAIGRSHQKVDLRAAKGPRFAFDHLHHVACNPLVSESGSYGEVVDASSVAFVSGHHGRDDVDLEYNDQEQLRGKPMLLNSVFLRRSLKSLVDVLARACPMNNKEYTVRLLVEERDVCQEIVKRLKGTSEKVKRAQILLSWVRLSPRSAETIPIDTSLGSNSLGGEQLNVPASIAFPGLDSLAAPPSALRKPARTVRIEF
jgi:hypothetical protein